MVKDHYLRLLAVMLLVATMINTTGEYVVGEMATDRSEVYATEQAATSSVAATPGARVAAAHDAQERYIGTFYSNYYAIVNLASALLQALVVAWLLSALGIRRALFVMPLVVLAGWFGLLLFANLTMVRIEKVHPGCLSHVGTESGAFIAALGRVGGPRSESRSVRGSRLIALQSVRIARDATRQDEVARRVLRFVHAGGFICPPPRLLMPENCVRLRMSRTPPMQRAANRSRFERRSAGPSSRRRCRSSLPTSFEPAATSSSR